MLLAEAGSVKNCHFQDCNPEKYIWFLIIPALSIFLSLPAFKYFIQHYVISNVASHAVVSLSIYQNMPSFKMTGGVKTLIVRANDIKNFCLNNNNLSELKKRPYEIEEIFFFEFLGYVEFVIVIFYCLGNINTTLHKQFFCKFIC